MGGFLFRDRFSQRSKRWRSESSQAHLAIETLERRCMLSVNVLTWHNDLTRQGQNTDEVVLTPASVNTSTFGELVSYPVHGQVCAQPLCVSNLAIPAKRTRNVVFVAAQDNDV